MATYQQVLYAYAQRYGLSRSQRELLQHASSGLKGPQLAAALRITLSELASLETLFEGRRGCTLDEAAREIEAIVRHRSSRPPVENTTSRIQRRALDRARRRNDDRAKTG